MRARQAIRKVFIPPDKNNHSNNVLFVQGFQSADVQYYGCYHHTSEFQIHHQLAGMRQGLKEAASQPRLPAVAAVGAMVADVATDGTHDATLLALLLRWLPLLQRLAA